MGLRDLARQLDAFARQLGLGLLELGFPPTCAACGGEAASGAALCDPCGARLSAAPPAPAVPRPLAELRAGAAFAGDVENWVHRFKYPRAGIAGLDPTADAVVHWLVRRAAASAPVAHPSLVVPVPLHPRRQRARGFNPAALLARSVARQIAAPCATRALVRVVDTPSQTGLDRRARARNVRHAFRARSRQALPRDVWLVDDVVTTGATLAACARVLRDAGARRVVGICAARTP